MSFYKDKVSILDGNILLYTTTTQKNQMWQMRLKFPRHLHRGYITKSTGCREFGAASSFAEQTYWRMYSDLKDGIELGVNRSFVAQFEKFMQFNVLNSGITLSKSTISTFKYYGKYWCEFFDTRDVRYITTQIIDEYMSWRVSYWTNGPGMDKKKPPNVALTPSAKTMQGDRQRLKQFFRHLHNVNVIRQVPIFTIPARQKKAKRRQVGNRDHFTNAEWNRVSNRLNAYAFGTDSEKFGPRTSYERKLIYYYLMISANLGTRPGETRKIIWKHVNFKPHPDDASIYVVSVYIPPDRKTGSYTALGTLNCVKYFHGVRELFRSRFEREPTDADNVFTNYKGLPYSNPEVSFKRLLRQWNEYRDPDGRSRTIYSLRGYYITQLLEKGVSVHQVAKTCGTSVKQIEAHYDRSSVKLSVDILSPGFLKK
jgi:integrase